ALEDVGVVRAQPGGDLLRHPEPGAAGAGRDRHAGTAGALSSVPDALLHEAVGTDDGAVEIEDQQRDHRVRKPSSASCSASKGAGACVSGSPPRWFLGKAMVSRMLGTPASSMTSLSKPQATPPCGGAPYE